MYRRLCWRLSFLVENLLQQCSQINCSLYTSLHQQLCIIHKVVSCSTQVIHRPDLLFSSFPHLIHIIVAASNWTSSVEINIQKTNSTPLYILLAWMMLMIFAILFLHDSSFDWRYCHYWDKEKPARIPTQNTTSRETQKYKQVLNPTKSHLEPGLTTFLPWRRNTQFDSTIYNHVPNLTNSPYSAQPL